jgi:hypothetical protein
MGLQISNQLRSEPQMELKNSRNHRFRKLKKKRELKKRKEMDHLADQSIPVKEARLSKLTENLGIRSK